MVQNNLAPRYRGEYVDYNKSIGDSLITFFRPVSFWLDQSESHANRVCHMSFRLCLQSTRGLPHSLLGYHSFGCPIILVPLLISPKYCIDRQLYYFVRVSFISSYAQKHAEGSSANAFILKLVGKAATSVVYRDRNDNLHTAHQSKDLVEYDVQLAAFGGKVANGTHIFPFSVMLPPDLPSSMKVRVTRVLFTSQ